MVVSASQKGKSWDFNVCIILVEYRSSSEYNRRVKNQIISDICSMPECKYDREQVKGMVKKSYWCP